MTMDQCLSCTRYEPILGQVYAILDDSGTNISQILDDMQMAYMDKDEYMKLTRTEELFEAKNYAEPSNHGEQPKAFSEIFEEGFKMDWNNTHLETQRANIAKYDTEGIEANKPVIKSENQGVVEPEFKDSIEEDEEYETLKYNSEDYTFQGFGESFDSSISSDGLFGQGGAAIRNKIVEYAENALKLCQEGKAGYSQDYRYNHIDNPVNGIHYWDCSSLAEGAYKAAGITEIQGTTYTEYPVCLPTAGGIILNIDEEDNALPGDLVWFTDQDPKPKTQEELKAANIGAIGHVGIYVGNGEYIHASTDGIPLTEQIKKSPTKNWDSRIFAFGRPKALVEADSKVALASDSFDPDKQKLPADLRDEVKERAKSWASGVITHNATWNYAPIFAKICKEKSEQYNVEIDPYMMMAMSGVEAGGNPYAGGPDPGLMQLAPGSGGASMPSHVKPGTDEATQYFETQIRGAIDHLMGKRKDIMAICGEEFGTWPLTIYGYNSGQGTVTFTIQEYNLKPMTGGEFAPYIKKYVAESGIIPYPQVRYEYFARVLWTYQHLLNEKLI